MATSTSALFCSCCGRRLKSATVFANETFSLVVCHRCRAWRPYGAETPDKRVTLSEVIDARRGRVRSARRDRLHALVERVALHMARADTLADFNHWKRRLEPLVIAYKAHSLAPHTPDTSCNSNPSRT